MRWRPAAAGRPRKSLSSLILASISGEGESPAFPCFEPLPVFFMVVVAFFMVVVARPPLTFVRRAIGWLASLRPSPTSWTSFWQRRRAFRSRVCSLVHPFEQIFEVVEPALPEPGHLACPVGERGPGAELRAIVRLATFVTVAHQPGLLQDPEML